MENHRYLADRFSDRTDLTDSMSSRCLKLWSNRLGKTAFNRISYLVVGQFALVTVNERTRQVLNWSCNSNFLAISRELTILAKCILSGSNYIHQIRKKRSNKLNDEQEFFSIQERWSRSYQLVFRPMLIAFPLLWCWLMKSLSIFPFFSLARRLAGISYAEWCPSRSSERKVRWRRPGGSSTDGLASIPEAALFGSRFQQNPRARPTTTTTKSHFYIRLF